MFKQLLIISGFINDQHPTGGVTMHVHRLIKQLIEPHIPNYELCDYKKEGLIQQVLKIRRADVMHIHASNPYLKLFYVVVGKLFKTRSLITVHGRFGSFNKWKNAINKIALKWCDIPILINRESFENVLSFNHNSVLIPAFIPPIEEEEIIAPDIASIIENMKGDGKPLFVTNASSMAFTDDGREIYGISFLIEFFSRHSEFNLLMLDPQGVYSAKYKDCLPSNVCFITGTHSFCGVIQRSDLVVRNTPVDGDSFSVKEALCYHKRVIVTDAVTRPEGVFLFSYNDEASFEKAIKDAFSFYGEIGLKDDTALIQYKNLYSSFGVC